MKVSSYIYASLVAGLIPWFAAIMFMNNKIMVINFGMGLITIGLIALSVFEPERYALGYASLALFFGIITAGIMFASVIPFLIIMMAVIFSAFIMMFGVIISFSFEGEDGSVINFGIKSRNKSNMQHCG